MFERSIEKELSRWSADRYRKPLILRGARQVGKTTVVQRFACMFENYLSVNLEKGSAVKIFESTDDVRQLLPLLFLYCNVKKREGKTLLFIDEIQNSPHTVALLRYFYEELPEIYVIAAGSLLETLLDRHISMPVGRVQYMSLHPCSFAEFLTAVGESRFSAFLYNGELPVAFHDQLSALFNNYSLIGGMPEVVARYAADRDFTILDDVYNSLLNSYKSDIEKYAKNNSQAAIIRYILEEGWVFSGETITLGSFGGSSYRARETGEAFRLLERALLLELVYPLTNALMPMISSLKRSPKLFWLDAGLVNYVSRVRGHHVFTDLLSGWRGKFAEHLVYQELKSLSFDVGHRQHFWVRDKRGSTAEVDFVYYFDGILIPIEVKSGHNAHLKSLHQYMDTAPHSLAVRIWSGFYSTSTVHTPNNKTFTLINLPFYMISALPNIIKRLVNLAHPDINSVSHFV
jgi:predicted AAA+ superfamily ATPase